MGYRKLRPASLYRHFDAEDRLLYVGISLHPFRRLSDHIWYSHWAAKIKTVTIENHPHKNAALLAEERAIKTELPLFNVRADVREGI